MNNRVELNKKAPDFTLTDFMGQVVRLSDFQDHQNVLLVFNRGFF
jgi:peroxiredoxin